MADYRRDYPQSAWEMQGVSYEDWFAQYPVTLRQGHDIVCAQCGAQVGVKAGRLHIEWHEENDGTT